MSNPLIVTLTLDKKTQSFLTSLRTKYFPPHRNHLPAHITLFHAIPASRFHELDDELTRISQQSPFDVFFVSPRKMGAGGVMVPMRQRPTGSVEEIHQSILDRLMSGGKELIDQDQRPLGRVHVTVMNKAEPKKVDECLGEVVEVFKRMEGGQLVGKALGLEAWEYVGGPWKPLKSYTFRASR